MTSVGGRFENVPSDPLEGDSIISYLVNLAVTIVERLDTDTVRRVCDVAFQELDVADSVTGSSRAMAYRANRQAVSAGAMSVLECNTLRSPLLAPSYWTESATYRSGIDCYTIILIVHSGTIDEDVCARANVKAIRVMSHLVGG